MSKFNVRTIVKKPVRFLMVEAGVRYWEDGEVNGVPDDNKNPRMPFAGDDGWRPVIDLETGQIQGWPEGVTAKTHYKVCDDGRYSLVDEGGNQVAKIEGYVPPMLSPAGQGYGDYMIMNIGPDGRIENWRVDLSPFEPDDKED